MKQAVSVMLLSVVTLGAGCAYFKCRARDFGDLFTLAVEDKQYGCSARCLYPVGFCAAQGSGWGLREGHVGGYQYADCGFSLLTPFLCIYTWRLDFTPSGGFRNKDYCCWYKMYAAMYSRGGASGNGDYQNYLEGLNIQANVGLYYGLRAGVNLPEVADFFAGLACYDLLGDDIASAPSPDPRESVDRARFLSLRERAIRGDPAVQYELGVCYSTGRGVVKNAGESAQWFRRAAEQGQRPAQFQLGLCYRDGSGIPQNLSEAFAWLTVAGSDEAIQCRDALKKRMSALQCRDGESRARALLEDYGSSAALQTQAKAPARAEKGAADAPAQVENRIVVGPFTDTESKAAAKRWRAAAENNDAAAQYSLGLCYAEGLGVEKSAAEAVAWFRKAAEKNHVLAQWQLALACHLGLGAEKDDVEAYAWASVVAEAGYASAHAAGVEEYAWSDLVAQAVRSARQEREEWARALSPEQVAAGGKRAKDTMLRLEQHSRRGAR